MRVFACTVIASEAKQSISAVRRSKHGLLRFARNDGRRKRQLRRGRRIPRRRDIQYAAASRFDHCCLWNTGSPGLSRVMTTRMMCSRSRDAMRPSFAGTRSPSEREGAGKTGCALHPRSRVQCASKEKRTRAYRFSGNIRPSLRDGFTAYIVLSPENGLCCHRRSREALASRKLDTSVGVSGPHDFAVRNNIARPHARSARDPSRPPHPAPHVRDDRDTPLLWARDGRADSADLPDGESEIFFVRGMDRKLLICPSGFFCASGHLSSSFRGVRSTSPE